ncbi:GMP/IMP nucleotidase [Aliikangiella sp. IMCC44653]
MNPKINWDEIDTVLLDMDGTILDLSFDNYFWLELVPQVFAQKNSLSLAQSHQNLALRYEKIKGTLNWYCLDYWSEELGLDIVGLKQSIKHKVAYRPAAQEFLKMLNSLKKEVILVTNAHPKSLQVKLTSVDFSHYFNSLTSSHDFGVPKEEQHYWVQLKQKFNFDCERTLFVDDSVSILQAAKRFGIKYCIGIAQPASNADKIDTAPFAAFHDFAGVKP